MMNYRYPNEIVALVVTMLVVLGVLLLSAGLTLCLAPLIFALFMLLAVFSTRSMHQQVLASGERITPANAPQLYNLVEGCKKILTPGAVEMVVVPSHVVNAYTFGLSNPKVIVLNSPMLKIMDTDELSFIIGHEMGHVDLGHTWLNTILGGLAGMPPSIGAAALLHLVFRGWNRTCEYSADRAGLIACGSLRSATTALVKLVAHNARTPEQIENALKMIDEEDEHLGNLLAETFATHPLIINRIEQLRDFAASSAYKHWVKTG